LKDPVRSRSDSAISFSLSRFDPVRIFVSRDDWSLSKFALARALDLGHLYWRIIPMPVQETFMISRTHYSTAERETRSRAAQLLANQPFLRGSLVLRYRTCGKSYCRCQRGQKHPALYLYTRSGKKQVCTYIPRPLHEMVRQWVDNGRRLKRLVEHVSQQHLQDLWEQKQSLAQPQRGADSESHAP
jgi:hypothetical protein